VNNLDSPKDDEAFVQILKEFVVDFRTLNSRHRVIKEINKFVSEGFLKLLFVKYQFFNDLLKQDITYLDNKLEGFNSKCIEVYKQLKDELSSEININNIIDRIIEFFPTIKDFNSDIEWYKEHSISPFIGVVFSDYIKINQNKIDKHKLNELINLMILSKSSLIRETGEELYDDFLDS